MSPIIFLDVDGVLNHRAVFTPRAGVAPLCPHAVGRFLKLVEETKAEVVLSSTWRLPLGDRETIHIRKLRAESILAKAHKDWRTIDLPVAFQNGLIVDSDPRRGYEIAEWLSRHPEHTNFVIIDDDADMLPEQIPYFIQTSFDTGLLDEHCDQARAILLGAVEAL